MRVCICFAFAACIPAHVPDNLGNTPGPSVIVTGGLFQSSQFTARYPDGWRIVTGEASASPSVIFSSPDETATIQLMVGTLEAMNFPDSPLQTDIRGLTLTDNLSITAILRAPPEDWDAVLPVFEWVLESVRAVK